MFGKELLFIIKSIKKIIFHIFLILIMEMFGKEFLYFIKSIKK
jgi:hypothetical protein